MQFDTVGRAPCLEVLAVVKCDPCYCYRYSSKIRVSPFSSGKPLFEFNSGISQIILELTLTVDIPMLAHIALRIRNLRDEACSCLLSGCSPTAGRVAQRIVSNHEVVIVIVFKLEKNQAA